MLTHPGPRVLEPRCRPDAVQQIEKENRPLGASTKASRSFLGQQDHEADTASIGPATFLLYDFQQLRELHPKKSRKQSPLCRFMPIRSTRLAPRKLPCNIGDHLCITADKPSLARSNCHRQMYARPFDSLVWFSIRRRGRRMVPGVMELRLTSRPTKDVGACCCARAFLVPLHNKDHRFGHSSGFIDIVVAVFAGVLVVSLSLIHGLNQIHPCS